MAKSQPARKTVYRDSDKGRFITRKEAEKNPKTSEKERVRTGKQSELVGL